MSTSEKFYKIFDILHANVNDNSSIFCSEISAVCSFFADFPANFVKFQILSKRSIFVVQKHLLYEIASNFNKKTMKIYLSDLLNY